MKVPRNKKVKEDWNKTKKKKRNAHQNIFTAISFRAEKDPGAHPISALVPPSLSGLNGLFCMPISSAKDWTTGPIGLDAAHEVAGHESCFRGTTLRQLIRNSLCVLPWWQVV
ncbi:hypothetical protein NPIL_134771 [Nephila pilipes]|uniref:Uncharacterized protein n=1 Tax=Nephila pilipes TaxID=299642 RepID=A0A8X6UJ11_NEPPI|nr:hypothetical protein NPIL_134771 [Nephila pilipes]